MPYIGNTTSDFSVDTGNITNRAVTALKLSPSSVGSNGQVLSVDGSGNLQWSADASGTSLTGSTNNTITTVTGANAITGEANLTFNDSVLSIINTSNLGDAFLYIKAGEAGASVIELQADEADDSNDLWRIQNAGDSKLGFRSKESGSWVEKLGITADGNTTFAGSLIISEDNAIHLKGATDSDLDSIVRESSGNALLINSRNDAILNIDSNGDSTDAHFAVAHGAATSGSTELFRIDESCRVGIGGNGTGNGLGVFLRRSAPTTTNFYEASDGTKAMIAGVDSTLDYVKIGSLTAHRLGLVASNGEKISVLADGKVGIGTTSPGWNLQVSGSNTTIDIEATGWAQLRLTGGSSENYITSDDNLSFYVGGTEKVFINTDGAVGIGTDDPRGSSTYQGLELNGTSGGVVTFSVNEVEKWNVYGADAVYGIYDRVNTRYNFKCHSDGDVELPSGNLKLASGKGIMFHPHDAAVSSPGSDSNLLDDYEEGTFDPTLRGHDGSSWSEVTFDSVIRYGWYTKIGNVCRVWIRFYNFHIDSGFDGDLAAVGGLPFSSSNTAYKENILSICNANAFAESGAYNIALDYNTNTGITRLMSGTGSGYATFSGSTGRYLTISGSYSVG